MYYFGTKPHKDRKRRMVESVNELLIFGSCYHIVFFSEFNTHDEAKFTMGYSFISLLFLVVIFNVVVAFHKILTSLKLRRMIMQKKKQLEEKIKKAIR